MAVAYAGDLCRTAGPMARLVVPPPGPPRGGEERYEAMVGDVWMVGLLREVGVDVAPPVGWTSVLTYQGVPDPERPRVLGDLTLWYYTLVTASAPGVVEFSLPRAVWAKAMLRVYRAAGAVTCPRCGRTSRHPEDVRQGYCGNCHDWTASRALTPRELALRWAAETEV